MKNLIVAGVFFAGTLLSWSQTQKVWTLTNSSTLAYTAVHPLHEWSGTSKSVQGIMTTKDDVPQKLAIKASVKSFDSQNSNRDAHALEVLDALRFPDVSFSSIKFSPENNSFSITGNLEFHGIKQQKTVPLKIQKNGDKWEISGSFQVSLTAHEIDPPSFMLVKTKDNITIGFDLIFVEKQNVK